jgi:hypothetical protein
MGDSRAASPILHKGQHADLAAQDRGKRRAAPDRPPGAAKGIIEAGAP